MAASRFSSDEIEMFSGPIPREENARLQPPLRSIRDFDFQLERTNFNKWLRVWKMKVSVKFKADLLKFAQKTKSRFAEESASKRSSYLTLTFDDYKWRKTRNGALFQTERSSGFQHKQRGNSK